VSYTLGALNDFMQVGPQVYPERANAVQVIMRGPHGQRMAADPVRTREGQARGSGFRTWVEQLNVPADQAWNPPQRVVGLLGLGGAVGSSAERSFRVAYQNFRGAPDSHARAGYATQGRAIWNMLTPDERSTNSAEMQVMAVALGDRTVYSQQVADAPELTTQESLDASRARLEAARRAAEAARRRGGTTMLSQLSAEDVAARAAECARNPRACAEDPTGEQSTVRRGYGGGGRPLLEGLFSFKTFATVGVLAAGGIAIYAFANAYGKGLAARPRREH
jgi:hypothetical protein